MVAPTLAESPAARAEATRARIEATAEQLFRTLGYQKTAVADIARELGMSPANVYRFFPSKSAINEAIAARLLQGMDTGAWAIARGDGSATDRLRRLLRYMHTEELGMFFAERRLHDMVTAAMAEHWDVIDRFLRSMVESIRHVLMDGMAAGEFARLDPGETAYTIKHAFMMFNHPVMVADCIGHGTTETQLAAELDRLVEFTLRALRP